MELTIALAQIPVSLDIQANVRVIRQAIEFAADHAAGVLLTPEGSLSGYTPDFDPTAVDLALAQVESAARQAGVALSLGTCRLESDALRYDQLRFYEHDGSFLGFHAKILRCGTMADDPQGEVKAFAARPLRTFMLGGVCVGGLICNDMWANPMCTPMPDEHLSWQLSRMGAKVVFHAVNGGRGEGEWSEGVCKKFHETNLRMRAAAGKLWVATVDNCLPNELPVSCFSGLIDPSGNWALRLPDRGMQMGVARAELAHA